MDLAARLKFLRERKSLSQSDVAKNMGFTRDSCVKWELGKNEPNNTALVKIAKYHNVSVDYLLCKTEIMFPPEDMPDINVEFMEILSSWVAEGCTPQEIREIWKQLQSIAEKCKPKQS